ncbi:hypothetical protein P2318_18975 [Myxococcaceae bacterium GXIMD 01537]
MTTICCTEFETRLHWRGEREALLTSDRAPTLPLVSSPAGGRGTLWDPESLLVGAVEGRTLLTFLERAREEGVDILFYQSSAVGRRVAGQDGQPQFTDLIVRPHVAVGSEEDAEKVRRIFDELPSRCFPSSMLNLTPRIVPIIESWNVRSRERRRPPSEAAGPSAP